MEQRYILQDTELSQERLKIQNTLYEESSQSLLLHAGLSIGMHVLEVGCGTGLMTMWLAEVVGITGKVFAFDINPTYVEITQSACTSKENIEVRCRNVYDIEKYSQLFDIIYCRLVLHHLKHPALAIQKMVKCLKPGGKLVCEEAPAAEGVFSYPPSESLNQLVEWVVNCFRKNESEYRVAYQMDVLFKKYGLTVEILEIFQPLLKPEHFVLHAMALNDLAPRIIQHKIADKKEIEALADKLTEELPNSNCVSLYRLFKIVGCKPMEKQEISNTLEQAEAYTINYT